ncbi:hypothetical protein CAPTEDRAFT_188892 [Capitella teleta]|uniref:Uncharacterized protein n=1 Tax=Capitella teleta TaxID=283909 RepID=R7TRZ6_CAPTE|nr:hypothetical protein CAPTEDRAFT_188892 [Capitella teleta]|eukprot:ELT96347.1 hypothetical protein CAPTEDRAFT_188892 [Capitella teleta]
MDMWPPIFQCNKIEQWTQNGTLKYPLRDSLITGGFTVLLLDDRAVVEKNQDKQKSNQSCRAKPVKEGDRVWFCSYKNDAEKWRPGTVSKSHGVLFDVLDCADGQSSNVWHTEQLLSRAAEVAEEQEPSGADVTDDAPVPEIETRPELPVALRKGKRNAGPPARYND